MHKVTRQGFQDNATLYRDAASIASLADREATLDKREDGLPRRFAINTAQAASERMMGAHEKAEEATRALKSYTERLMVYQYLHKLSINFSILS